MGTIKLSFRPQEANKFDPNKAVVYLLIKIKEMNLKKLAITAKSWSYPDVRYSIQCQRLVLTDPNADRVDPVSRHNRIVEFQICGRETNLVSSLISS